MAFAIFNQKVQDWITQQWVILFGKRIEPSKDKWLIGPFGGTAGIGQRFIEQLALDENLEIDEVEHNKGLLRSINQLNLSWRELNLLSKDVIEFYENTGDYTFDLIVKWNPFFKLFGVLLKVLFSNRIEQLNIPLDNDNSSKAMKSEIVNLVDIRSRELKRTVWLRTFKSSGQVVYSGIYEVCIMPDGNTCIKAIFPLPNGNATVILNPSVEEDGKLVLKSSGKEFGDSGFYFMLKDSKNKLWSKYVKSFKDKLVVSASNNVLTAHQTLSLWNIRVVEFRYHIKKDH